jgi:DNA-binding CsgD family transcriptional regulator
VRACADLVEDARMRRDDSAVSAGQQAAVRLQEVRTDLLQDPFADHPFFLTVSIEGREWDAELRRCQGNDQPELWLALAQEWDSFGRPHRAGYAWWRAARALLDRGQRGPAAAALLTAHRRSDQHVPLSDAITRLARLSRVSLPPIVSGPPEPVTTARPTLGLTGRELDVLRLLTEGLTNAEIGSRLYMSPKTASVHVTAILRKLHATNRVQAAAIAERLGLTST